MTELQACRVCLTIDMPLYSIYSRNLVQTYEVLTGIKILETDNMPRKICIFCCRTLQNFMRFRLRCYGSQKVLKVALSNNVEITEDYIKMLDRSSLKLPYAVSPIELLNIPPIYAAADEPPTEIKLELADSAENEIDSDAFFNWKYESESDSDHKPLSKIKHEIIEPKPLKKLKKKKKLYLKKEETHREMEKDYEIILLTKQQQLEEMEQRKESSNYLNSPFKCDKCYKGFISESTYKNHVIRHSNELGDKECEICRIKFKSNFMITKHKNTTHNYRFVCRRCGNVCKNSTQAKEHTKFHQGVTYECQTCGSTYKKVSTYLTHMRCVHAAEQTRCETCGRAFLGARGLRAHRRRVHHPEIDIEPPPNSSCVLCGLRFATIEALAKHLGDNNICDSSPKPCLKCGEGFDGEQSYIQHTRVAHKIYKCDLCPRWFPCPRRMARHRYEHSRKVGVCHVCGRQCTTESALSLHMRTHTGEKPFQCEVCLKSFSIKQRLLIHTRTHTGEKPFKCQTCPKAFRQKAALNRHLRVHTGAKPYSCTHCGKSFSQSNSMKLHVATVHMKLPAPYKHKRNKVIDL